MSAAAKSDAPGRVSGIGASCQQSGEAKTGCIKHSAPATDSRSVVAAKLAEAESMAKLKAPLLHTSTDRRLRLLALLVETPGIDAETQVERVLRALRTGPVTTHELRQFIDVPHPAGRVSTLRKRGYVIVTKWVRQISAAGYVHRYGQYVLTRGVA